MRTLKSARSDGFHWSLSLFFPKGHSSLCGQWFRDRNLLRFLHESDYFFTFWTSFQLSPLLIQEGMMMLTIRMMDLGRASQPSTQLSQGQVPGRHFIQMLIKTFMAFTIMFPILNLKKSEFKLKLTCQ